jgi:hypothetical protein
MFEQTGFLHDAGDVDWFFFDVDGTCPMTQSASVDVPGVDSLCVWIECPDMNDFACPEDQQVVLAGDGLGGCCETAGGVYAELDLGSIMDSPCNPILHIWVSVEASESLSECTPYTATITASP